MFNPSRDQVRDFFFDAWARHRAGLPLEGAAALALAHILRHPEYHALLEAPERARGREWPPELGETNPFLHLSMHLSLDEQISIDQPPGVRARYAALCQRLGDEHAAQHAAMDCLGEMLWRAQRDGLPPDASLYLLCLETR